MESRIKKPHVAGYQPLLTQHSGEGRKVQQNLIEAEGGKKLKPAESILLSTNPPPQP